MKPLLMIVAFSLTALHSMSQTTEVVENKDINRSAIFTKTLLWVSDIWPKSDDVIDLKDEENGLIVLKAWVNAAPRGLGMRVTGNTFTKINITIKDGKSKVEFSDTYFRWAGGKVWEYSVKKSGNGKTYDNWHDAVDSEISRVVAAYKSRLSKNETDF